MRLDGGAHSDQCAPLCEEVRDPGRSGRCGKDVDNPIEPYEAERHRLGTREA